MGGYASSIHANAKMTNAAGQRPSRAGYSRAGKSRLPRATHASVTASDRHGLNARKTSPNSTLSTTVPTQKVT